MDLKLHLGHQILFQVGCIGKSFPEICNIQKQLFFIEEKMRAGDFKLLGDQLKEPQGQMLTELRSQFMFCLWCQSPLLQKMLNSSKSSKSILYI